MSGDLDGVKAALADAIPADGDLNAALTVIFGVLGELSWQLVNLLDDIDAEPEPRPVVPGRLSLAYAVNAHLTDALEEITEDEPTPPFRVYRLVNRPEDR